MPKKLFLLDGMALVYRGHFALVSRPIYTSKGVNSSALYVFTNTLLEILRNQQPTHITVVFDTAAPTARHREFPDYKIQREETPEDILQALPHVKRMAEALHIPVLALDGYEADDIIGTLVRRAEREGFESCMVTPDKDFGQLVSDKTVLFKPARTGDEAEVLGEKEILAKWGIKRPEQVIDILGLWGDASDNIPGVPGIGEKTAAKLIAQYDSVENLLAHSGELKGKLKENLETHRDQALLSKRLATINCEVPIEISLDTLKLRPPNEEALKRLLIEFEFNSIGRRLFGDEFKTGRGFEQSGGAPVADSQNSPVEVAIESEDDGEEMPAPTQEPIRANLKTLADVPHNYELVSTAADRASLIRKLLAQPAIAFAVKTDRPEAQRARLLGLAFSFSQGAGSYVPIPQGAGGAAVLSEFRPVFENEQIEKIGQDLKFDLSALKWQGIEVRGRLFDVMLAHALIEPDLQHTFDYIAESLLGYTPVAANLAPAAGVQLDLMAEPASQLAEETVERADLAGQLRSLLEPALKEKKQERVFYEVEAPLLPVLVDMECEGIRIDASALNRFAELLSRQMTDHEQVIYRLAGAEFNLNSPKQLGEILFEKLKLADAPKKTRTRQYATDEQSLLALAPDHEIVRRLLDYRTCSKLKSTYAETLPATISPRTGRVHTTYNQLVTATGRLNSINPNLQNIPIRSELGQEIRKAFVPRDADHVLLSADYSQIELRIIAALSKEKFLIEAFESGADIHAATAARVFGAMAELVTPEMRDKAKMVNYGISYGMSAFGLAQRLGIPRKEAAQIIEQYFAQFPGIRQYMTDAVEFARKHGYVETVTGRRRYLRDIRSANATVRGSAERNAINAPIQGSAADMIKIAMIRIHRELFARKLRTRMLLQVHDELVFDLYKPEEAEVRAFVEENMKTAIKLDVPIEVEMGTGNNWLEAH